MRNYNFRTDPNKKNAPGLTSFYYYWLKPTNCSFIFTLFSKNDQLKIKLANLIFSKIGDGPDFLPNCFLKRIN